MEALKNGNVDKIDLNSVEVTLNGVADWMANKAYNMGSQDNITVSILYMSRCGDVSTTGVVSDGGSYPHKRRSRGEDEFTNIIGDTNSDNFDFDGKRRQQENYDRDIFTSLSSQSEYDESNVRGTGVDLNPSQPAPKPIIHNKNVINMPSDPKGAKSIASLNDINTTSTNTNTNTNMNKSAPLPKDEADDLMDFLLDDSNF